MERISPTALSAPGRSALFTTKMSPISITPALIVWISSPEPGIATRTTESASSAMSISDWPTPTVSTTTSSSAAASRARAQRRSRGKGLRAPRREAADEHCIVGQRGGRGAALHPDPVAEYRTARKGARRIDCEHGDSLAAPAVGADQLVDETALARAGRTGDADYLREAQLVRRTSFGAIERLAFFEDDRISRGGVLAQEAQLSFAPIERCMGLSAWRNLLPANRQTICMLDDKGADVASNVRHRRELP